MTTLEDRVATKFWYQNRYAKLIVSMSLAEAKEILGFPRNANPSPEEISKAYKRKAVENHPDRGGDTAKMVEINVAKDLLDGKGRQTPDHGSYSRPPKKEPIKKGRDFANAKSEAPAGVDWRFRSSYQFGKTSDYAKKASEPGIPSYTLMWVCYGQTASQHVFLLVEHCVPNKFGDVLFDEWSMGVTEMYPLTQDITKLAPKAIKSIMQKGKLTDGVQRGSPKFMAMKELAEADLERREGGVSLKDILIGTGLTSGAKSDRKTVIEMSGKLNQQKVQEDRKSPNRIKSQLDVWKLYDFTLYVNGKPYPLSDQTMKNLGTGHGMSGGLFWIMVYSPVKYDFSIKRVITKVQTANAALEMIENSLSNEPPELTVALLKAMEETGSKTAAMARSVASRFTGV